MTELRCSRILFQTAEVLRNLKSHFDLTRFGKTTIFRPL